MKKGMFFLLALIVGHVQAQKTFTISGKLTGISDTIEKVYVSYRVGEEWKSDSAMVVNQRYQLSGSIEEPVLMMIRPGFQKSKVKLAMNMQRNMASVFLSPGKLAITHIDSMVNVQVKGSKAHQAYQSLQEKLKPTNEEMMALNNEYRALATKKDEEGLKKLEEKFEALDRQQKDIYKTTFLENPASPIAPFMLDRFAGWEINADEVDPLFEKLPEAAKQLPSGKDLAEKLQTARLTGIGKIAPDFIQNDTLGNPVSLASFRGKYLLIDFWASWCGPCRQENPNVVKAFNKYKEKGFHILGVSLDQNNAKEKWVKAIHDDNLTWTHVSDLQYWKNAVAVQYGIQAIPQNFLLDREGKIIAKNLRGEDLDAKLGELLK